MFEFVRRHTKAIMVIMFLVVFPSFVLFGIGDYTSGHTGAEAVATIDGQKIRQDEWDRVQAAQADTIRAQNPNIDAALLDSPQFKYRILEQMIRERVLAIAAQEEYLTVDNQRLAQILQNSDVITRFKKEDGSIDLEAYRQSLAAQGYTPESFEANARQTYAINQVLGGVAQSSFATKPIAEISIDAFGQRREVQIANITPADYEKTINPTDEQLQNYYKENINKWQVPARADIEYIVLNLDALKKGVAVSEDDLRTYYEQNKESMGKPEERRAAHILITAGDSPEEKAAAKKKAEELIEQIKKDPAQFESLAKEHSQDDISAKNGGDLGFFTKARGLDPAITKATYDIAKKGEISEPVESEFGYHIIKLTDIKPADIPTYESQKARLEDDLRSRAAQKEYAEKAEEFRNSVYDNSDSLEPTAKSLGLEIKKAQGIEPTPKEGAEGELADTKLLNAIFSEEAITKKHNTDAIDTGDNTLISARITNYAPAHATPYEQATANVKEQYIKAEAAKLAQKAGQEALEKLKAGAADTNLKFNAAQIVSRRELTPNMSAQLLNAIMRADSDKLPQYIGTSLGDAGYAIAKVEKILPPTEQDQSKEAQDGYIELFTQAEQAAYYESLLKKYKVKINVPKPSQQAASH